MFDSNLPYLCRILGQPHLIDNLLSLGVGLDEAGEVGALDVLQQLVRLVGELDRDRLLAGLCLLLVLAAGLVLGLVHLEDWQLALGRPEGIKSSIFDIWFHPAESSVQLFR